MNAVLGIDIAKAKFNVTLQHADGTRRRKVCVNSAAGFAELVAWLQRQGVEHVHACLEATGTYGEALATYLFDAGYGVSLVNPARVHHYAQSQLARAKTDRVDADLIADFTATQTPPLWTPLPREQRELQALIRRLDALLTMQTQEKNRLASGEGVPAVRVSIETVLASLAEQIRTVRRLIQQHINEHPGLREQRDLLTSIPGIGDATAALLLGEVFVKRYASPRQAAAFVGLVPRVAESGTLVRRARLSKTGSSLVRKALYFPALTALRHNPSIHALGIRLSGRGKPNLVIIGAAMRKLIHLAFGVLKSGRAFQSKAVGA
jgi:transposase